MSMAINLQKFHLQNKRPNTSCYPSPQIFDIWQVQSFVHDLSPALVPFIHIHIHFQALAFLCLDVHTCIRTYVQQTR